MTTEMPHATVALTAPDGVLRTLGVALDDWEYARDDLVARAAARGWPGPYLIAPAPGKPEGVTLPGLPMAPTTWGHLSTRWFGRRVRVRWEETPTSSTDVRPFPGGRPIVRTGLVFATGDGWRLHTDDGLVAPPAFAHVVDVPS